MLTQLEVPPGMTLLIARDAINRREPSIQVVVPSNATARDCLLALNDKRPGWDYAVLLYQGKEILHDEIVHRLVDGNWGHNGFYVIAAADMC